MQLTVSQKRQLFEQGYVTVPGVVPDIMTDAAIRAINRSLGEGLPPERLPIYRAQSFCPELQAEPVITDLLHKTPAFDLLGSVIDTASIEPVRSGQIALRFPGKDDPPGNVHPHIDGMYSPTNGVPKGIIGNFTALVGIFLSDVAGPYAGNFTVWPGSHRINGEYFREHGAESLLNGMPPVELPEPVQVTARRGDIVIAHYTLSHGVSQNLSPHTRYAIFFRIKHKGITKDNWQRSMENIWLHWPGLHPFTGGHA
ncbi:phytanoyl-CoA dioxygenase [Paenibacillus sp. 32O-W]|uniref:phytanoyl-CoA dioxygenase family protein n=1 Tax=Paenibacillus sp. 32O-W TaxID=1695218 RepID=UPI000721453A|nr:phytanoyl-CoA dioxygenase family protein [Paenibacillus sp. 32O-W]ALS28307.1 phytanoyl-CoA dioxygenase [Paenibacillus sp. 32O-W]